MNSARVPSGREESITTGEASESLSVFYEIQAPVRRALCVFTVPEKPVGSLVRKAGGYVISGECALRLFDGSCTPLQQLPSWTRKNPTLASVMEK